MSDILPLARPYPYDPPPIAWAADADWRRLHATIVARAPELAPAPACQLARLARTLYAELPARERSLGAILAELRAAWWMAQVFSA